MINIVIIIVIGVIVGAAVGYISKEKKKGVRCIGCPDAGTCGGNCQGGCGGIGNTDELQK